MEMHGLVAFRCIRSEHFDNKAALLNSNAASGVCGGTHSEVHIQSSAGATHSGPKQHLLPPVRPIRLHHLSPNQEGSTTCELRGLWIDSGQKGADGC
jgi:hypothetical protein